MRTSVSLWTKVGRSAIQALLVYYISRDPASFAFPQPRHKPAIPVAGVPTRIVRIGVQRPRLEDSRPGRIRCLENGLLISMRLYRSVLNEKCAI